MNEKANIIQREIAKDKIQIILASIALAVLIIMEFYIMINFKSNFIAMAVGVLLMIIALFFLISALMDQSLKQKHIEQEKYEEIYNAQKASYLVIKKSFEELEQRLKVIEESSSLPAEDIINAQKAVAKVTISRSKENTDALMNSNDELINQLINIQEKLESSNTQLIEKQQSLLKESNFDIQQKIAELTNQITLIEGKIQNGIPVMAAQPVQMAAPVMPQQVQVPVEETPVAPVPTPVEEPVMEEIPLEEPVAEEIQLEDIPAEEPVAEEIQLEEVPAEEPADDLGLDLDVAVEEPQVEEPLPEEIPVEEVSEEPVAEEIQLEEVPIEEVPIEESVDDLGLDLDSASEEPVDDLGLDLDAAIEEPAEEATIEEVPENAAVEEVAEEPSVEEIPAEEPAVEEIPAEEIKLEEAPADEVVLEEAPQDPGANLDALLEEIGETVEESEPEPEPEPEPAAEEPKEEAVIIPDVGVDLTDPNRVMSPEEIEKLFANI